MPVFPLPAPPARLAPCSGPADRAASASGTGGARTRAALRAKIRRAATLRAYRADWAHYAAWCAEKDFIPVPAAPATIGAYLASLGESHAPSTIRRRLSAIGKMHRFNGLLWNPAHHDIQAPLRGVLRLHGRPPKKAPALTLDMLRRLVETCDNSARGRRDRALLLFGFAGALRRSELVALQADDVQEIAGGLRLRIRRSKTDPSGQGAELGLPRGQHLRPARCAPCAIGWRSPNARPGRCSGASAKPARSAPTPCTRMPSGIFCCGARRWPGCGSMAPKL